MVGFKVKFTKQAVKDLEYLKAANLSKKAKKLVDIMKENPYQNPPPYEKLIGDLDGMYSRRINIQHRLVYEVDNEENIIKIIRMWKHYE
jgi:Txe/YoeB family toxin of toxin-antitoxin system